MTTTAVYHDNLAHLRGALLTLNLRLHRQVLRRRASHHADATPDDLLGLTLADCDVDPLLDSLYADGAADGADDLDRAPIATVSTLLAGAEERHARQTAASLAAGVDLALPRIGTCLDLDGFAQQVVLLALAPEIDRRYERLFALLNNDAAARWPTVDLALSLFLDGAAARAAARAAFAPDAPLVRQRVIRAVEEPGGPRPTLLARGFALEERVVAELVGQIGARDPTLADVVETVAVAALPPPAVTAADRTMIDALGRRFADGAPRAIPRLHGSDREALIAVAAACARARGLDALAVVDGEALAAHPAPLDAIERVFRDARLTGAAPVLIESTALHARPALAGLQGFLRAPSTLVRFLVAVGQPALPEAPAAPSIHDVVLAPPDLAVRRELWGTALAGADVDPADLAELADRFRLTTRQIGLAVAGANARAAVAGSVRPRRADLFASCRQEAGAPLADLAERVESQHTWDDIILPPATKTQLRGLEQWEHNRHRVYREWGFERRVMLGRGLAALFTGPSGTGKTMAAGILARALGLDLYRIDLSNVVSKYIGETEKSLGRVFAAAEASSAILFFDEADALFGKRSEVKDAHDRYANIEVSYLLQRMESYDGIAVLATNFRQNLDQAFARRLQVTIEFPLPHPVDRERIWRRLLPPEAPQDDDVDLVFLAKQFALTGGAIKNCAIAAAFAAAAEDSPIAMRHLVHAVAKELAKLSQPIVRAQFGPYGDYLRGSHGSDTPEPLSA